MQITRKNTIELKFNIEMYKQICKYKHNNSPNKPQTCRCINKRIIQRPERQVENLMSVHCSSLQLEMSGTFQFGTVRTQSPVKAVRSRVKTIVKDKRTENSTVRAQLTGTRHNDKRRGNASFLGRAIGSAFIELIIALIFYPYH